MTNLEKLKAEVARLKEQVGAMREKQRLISERATLALSASKTNERFKKEKKKLSRELHPTRAKFSDYVKEQFDKRAGKKLTFKNAVKLAKKAYDGDL